MSQIDERLCDAVDPRALSFSLETAFPQLQHLSGEYAADTEGMPVSGLGGYGGRRFAFLSERSSAIFSIISCTGGDAGAWVFSPHGGQDGAARAEAALALLDFPPSPAMSHSQHCAWVVSSACISSMSDRLSPGRQSHALPVAPVVLSRNFDKCAEFIHTAPSRASLAFLADLASEARASVTCSRSECSADQQSEARNSSWLSRPLMCRCMQHGHRNLAPPRGVMKFPVGAVDAAAALMGGHQGTYTEHYSSLQYLKCPRLVPGAPLEFDAAGWTDAFGDPGDLAFPQKARVVSRTETRSVVLQFAKDAAVSHYSLDEASSWKATVGACASKSTASPPPGSIYARVRAAHESHGGLLVCELRASNRAR